MIIRKLLKPFLVVVGIVVLNFFNIQALVSDTCSGGISLFEDRHCGTEGWVPGSSAQYSIGNDVTLQPVSFFTTHVITKTKVFDDQQLSFNNNFSESVGRFSVPGHFFIDGIYLITTPWFTYDFFTYQKQPKFLGNILPVLIWLLNLPYWLGLAWMGNYLWNKNKYTKLIVSVFLIDKTIFTVGISLIAFLL